MKTGIVEGFRGIIASIVVYGLGMLVAASASKQDIKVYYIKFRKTQQNLGTTRHVTGKSEP